MLAHADLRTAAGWRVFAQLSAAHESGRRPGERAFDRSAPDLQQALVEIPVPVAAAPTTLRAGRQELDLGGTRLVGARDAANLRLAFDMAHLIMRPRWVDVIAFWGRPVLNQPGAFDDRASRDETFYGITFRRPQGSSRRAATAELLLLGRDRANAVYVDARGPEHRRLLGMRVGHDTPARELAAQVSYEIGRVDQVRVAAYGVAGTAGYRFVRISGSPRVAVDAGLTSGDRRSGDGRLDSYDPLYPNLGYFSDTPADYPINWMGVQPSLTLAPRANLLVRLGTSIHARTSRADGVYAPNGQPVIAGPAGGAFVDALTFVHGTWRAAPHLQFDAGYVHGSAGRVVTVAGGRDFDYGVFRVGVRF